MVDYIVKYGLDIPFGTEILQTINDMFINTWKVTQRKILQYLFFMYMPSNYWLLSVMVHINIFHISAQVQIQQFSFAWQEHLVCMRRWDQ